MLQVSTWADQITADLNIMATQPGPLGLEYLVLVHSQDPSIILWYLL